MNLEEFENLWFEREAYFKLQEAERAVALTNKRYVLKAMRNAIGAEIDHRIHNHPPISLPPFFSTSFWRIRYIKLVVVDHPRRLKEGIHDDGAPQVTGRATNA